MFQIQIPTGNFGIPTSDLYRNTAWCFDVAVALHFQDQKVYLVVCFACDMK